MHGQLESLLDKLVVLFLLYSFGTRVYRILLISQVKQVGLFAL